MTPLRINRDSLTGAVAALPREDWKYTDLSRAVDTGSRWIDAHELVSDAPVDAIEQMKSMFDANWLVFSNGRYLADQSDSSLGDGVSISALDHSEFDMADNPLAQLNADLAADGRKLTVSGELANAKPIAILVADSATAGAQFAQTRVDIVVNDASSVRVVEIHVSEGEQDLWSNTVFNVRIGRDARA